MTDILQKVAAIVADLNQSVTLQRAALEDIAAVMADLNQSVTLQRAILQEIAEILNQCDVQKWTICSAGPHSYLAICNERGLIELDSLFLDLFLDTGSYKVSAPWHNVACNLNDPESLSQQGLLRAINSVRERPNIV